MFEFCERLFHGVEAVRVFWQPEELCAGFADGVADRLPVCRNAFTQLTVVLIAPPERAAARLRAIPPVSTATTTRSRKSSEPSEDGVPINADLRFQPGSWITPLPRREENSI